MTAIVETEEGLLDRAPEVAEMEAVAEEDTLAASLIPAQNAADTQAAQALAVEAVTVAAALLLRTKGAA